VDYVEGERLWQLGWYVLFEERRDQALGLAASDHSTSTRRDGHRAIATKYLQLNRRTLHRPQTNIHSSYTVHSKSPTELSLRVHHQRLTSSKDGCKNKKIENNNQEFKKTQNTCFITK